MGHVTGASRYQTTLFPEALDEVISPNHPVRVVDAFVETLDLAALGFSKVVAEDLGRPPYAPGDLLKLYVYGYLNQARSSRRLAREARCNVEVMWLINRVSPAFKTIADFRKDHAKAIVGVCRVFIQFCRQQSLYGAQLLAIDGSKIEAVASRKKVITPKSLKKATAGIDRKIAEYLAAMDEADRSETADVGHLVDVAAAVKALRAQREQVQQQAKELSERGLSQLVATEPDAKLMRTARHGYQVAYNAQIAVDSEHKLIAAFDLINEGNDQRQLHAMAVQGQEALAADQITVVADTGYSTGEEGQRCEDSGVTAIAPRAETVNTEGQKYFSRDRFTYDAQSDTWQCPAGETLSCRETSQTEKNKRYWTDACSDCALKPQCTPGAKRQIQRSFFEDARERMHQRAIQDPTWMCRRREMAEHPFAIIKWLMGHPRFLVRGLHKAKAELALAVLSFNLKRVIEILGVSRLVQALQSMPT